MATQTAFAKVSGHRSRPFCKEHTMKRITYLAAAGALAATSGLGAWAANGATRDTPAAHVSIHARTGADDLAGRHGADDPAGHRSAPWTPRPRDNNGGVANTPEPGDDNGGVTDTPEPGDDNGGVTE